MTLVVCCYCPNGIVVSADSRTTGTQLQQIANPQNPKGAPISVQVPFVVSDSARKLYSVADRYMVATWGDAFLNGLPVSHHINDFAIAAQANLPATVHDCAQALLAHLAALKPTQGLGLLVAGYDGTTPAVFEVKVASGSVLQHNLNPSTKAVQFGLFWGGDGDIVGRLMSKVNVPLDAMNLQDAVDFTRHLIRTTIDQMRFEARIATVGGPIDTLTATQVRVRFVARKELHA